MSKIEWTDVTWNPIAGCSKVSEGCRNCYAIRTAHRLAGNPNPTISEKYEGTTRRSGGRTQWTGRVNLDERALEAPLRWRKPRRVFVNSMSDLFHDEVSDKTIAAILGVIAATPSHTYQILTKRPARVVQWFKWLERKAEQAGEMFPADDPGWRRSHILHAARTAVTGTSVRDPRHLQDLWPLPNLWLGVSVEDQATADERIPLILSTPAAVRFVSYEPALGPVDLSRYLVCGNCVDPSVCWCVDGKLDWVIAGGESGPGARPAHPDWFRAVRDQCQAAGIAGAPAFFLKQCGEWRCTRKLHTHTQWVNKAATNSSSGDIFLDSSGRTLRVGSDFETASWPVAIMRRVGKKAAGRELDGRTWDEFPEVTT